MDLTPSTKVSPGHMAHSTTQIGIAENLPLQNTENLEIKLQSQAVFSKGGTVINTGDFNIHLLDMERYLNVPNVSSEDDIIQFIKQSFPEFSQGSF